VYRSFTPSHRSFTPSHRGACGSRPVCLHGFAPAGGWGTGDDSRRRTLDFQATISDRLKSAAPHADAQLILGWTANWP
jgi:hypothetical protein